MAIGSKNWVVSLYCGQVQSANDVIQKSKQILNNTHPKRIRHPLNSCFNLQHQLDTPSTWQNHNWKADKVI